MVLKKGRCDLICVSKRSPGDGVGGQDQGESGMRRPTGSLEKECRTQCEQRS